MPLVIHTYPRDPFTVKEGFYNNYVFKVGGQDKVESVVGLVRPLAKAVYMLSIYPGFIATLDSAWEDSSSPLHRELDALPSGTILYVGRDAIDPGGKNAVLTKAPPDFRTFSGSSWSADRVHGLPIKELEHIMNSGPNSIKRLKDAATKVKGNEGKNIDIYVLDSGLAIDPSNPDLSSLSRKDGFTAYGTPFNEDATGHGTWVAAIAAGSLNGIAKKATIIPVRVLDGHGKGTALDVLKGLDFIFKEEEGKNRTSPAVINFSGGCEQYIPLSDAYERIITLQNCIVVAAAGNDGKDVTKTEVVPASLPGVISVAATTEADYQAGFSSWGGRTLRMCAPGVNITAGGYVWEGSSASAALVSGIIALYLGEDPQLTPATLRQELKTGAGTFHPVKDTYFAFVPKKFWYNID